MQEIFATLAGEPWCLTDPEQLLRLDRWWVRDVIFHPRNKDGTIQVKAKGLRPAPLSLREEHRAFYRRFDVPDWQEAKAWQEFQAAAQRGQPPAGPERLSNAGR